MPNRDDFVAARHAAFECANASGWLLNVAGKNVPTPVKEKWIARHLDQLYRALAYGWGVIPKVEHDLILSAPSTTVTAGGMTCPTAHRLAWDFASYLWESIRNLDRRLAPLFEDVLPVKPQFGDAVRFINAELVSKHLTAIVAELSIKRPFDAQHVRALIEHESARAIARLESARVEPAPPKNMVVPGFNFWVEDPKMQAAIDELRANPPDPFPKPEAVTLALLRWLLCLTQGPFPNAADHPDTHAMYLRVHLLIDRIPGFRELIRRLNSELRVSLSVRAMIVLRNRLSGCTGGSFEDVDGMLIREVAALPWPAGPASPDEILAASEEADKLLLHWKALACPSDPLPSGTATRPPEGDQTHASHPTPDRSISGSSTEDRAAGPDATPREEGQTGPDASGSKAPPPEGMPTSVVPAPPPAIDYDALATELRKQGKPMQAALVEYMADKPKAEGEDIAEYVHGDAETNNNTMWNNAKRTSDSLAALGSRLSFRFATGWMFREISPE